MNVRCIGSRWSVIFLGFYLGISSGRLAAQTNSVPNPEFNGTGGIVIDAISVNLLSGFVPDQWRAFAVGGGAAELEVAPVAADEVCPGCPAANSVIFRVITFGADQGFDDDNGRFPIFAAASYHAVVYIRSANSDGSDQHFNMGFPLFKSTGEYMGLEPGGLANQTATSAWQVFVGPEFLTPKGAAQGHISWRCVADGGEDAIQIALPSVLGDVITEFPVNLTCRKIRHDVRLDWENVTQYDALRVMRDGAELAVLDPADVSYTDPDVPDGVHTYQILATLQGFEEGPICETAVFRIPVGTVVSVDLNEFDIEDGLSNTVRNDGGDGENEFVICGPGEDLREARSNYGLLDPTPDYPDGIFYFTVTDPAMKAQPGFRLEVTVYDDPARAGQGLYLQYTNADATGPTDFGNTFYPQVAPPMRTLAGTDAWTILVWDIPDAGFRSFQQGQADFRLGVTDGDRLCIDRVDLTYLPAPAGLVCRRTEAGVELSWENTADYDGIRVSRNGEAIARLLADAALFIDLDAPAGINEYQVAAVSGAMEAAASCTVEVISVSPGASVSVDLGSQDFEDGLSNTAREEGTDGENEFVTCGPAGDQREARSNFGPADPTPDAPDGFFYFTVTDPAMKAQPGFRLEATVYDDPARAGAGLSLQYTNADATSPSDIPNTFYPQTNLPVNTLSGTDAWTTLVWTIPDAGFRSFQQGKADFRLGVTDGGRLCVDRAEVFFGACPAEGDTRCTGLAVEPPGGGPGIYTATAAAVDDSGDPVLYTFKVDDGVNPPLVIGPQDGSAASFALSAGEWTISVAVNDDRRCPNPSGAPSCEVIVRVGTLNPPKNLLAAAGDGIVNLSWNAPDPGPAFTVYRIYRDGAAAGEVPAAQMAFADSGRQNGTEYCYVVRAATGALESADSNRACATPQAGGGFKRGDANADGGVDLSDPVNVLGFLFLGNPTTLVCADAADADDTGELDITDAVYSLNWQFLGAKDIPAPGPFSCGGDPTSDSLPACDYPQAKCQ